MTPTERKKIRRAAARAAAPVPRTTPTRRTYTLDERETLRDCGLGVLAVAVAVVAFFVVATLSLGSM